MTKRNSGLTDSTIAGGSIGVTTAIGGSRAKSNTPITTTCLQIGRSMTA